MSSEWLKEVVQRQQRLIKRLFKNLQVALLNCGFLLIEEAPWKESQVVFQPDSRWARVN